MSENPYANYPQERARMGIEEEPAERVSVLAVLSLISAVICCIPGLGVLAVILGVGAMIGIRKSRGRVSGMGLAALGTLLGLIVSVVWAGVGLGAGQAFHYYSNTIAPAGGSILRAADAGDLSSVKGQLTSDAINDLTDEDFALFGEALRAEYGDFSGTPATFKELIDNISRGASAWQAMGQGKQGGSTHEGIPIPLDFDGGSTFGLFTIDPASGGGAVVFSDAGVMLPDGRALTLREDGPAKIAFRVQGVDTVTARELLAERSAGDADGDSDTDADDEGSSDDGG